MANIYNKPIEGEAKAPPTLEKNVTTVLSRMLRTAYTYANDVPDEVFIYFQIEGAKAGIDCLFKIDGKLYEVHDLNDSVPEEYSTQGYIPMDSILGENDDSSEAATTIAPSTMVYDVSKEHQQQLTGFLARGIQDYINLFMKAEKDIPNETWASIVISSEEKKSTLGYQLYDSPPLPSTQEALQKWKLELADPTKKIIDSFMLEEEGFYFKS
jgi:hypothetical protein